MDVPDPNFDAKTADVDQITPKIANLGVPLATRSGRTAQRGRTAWSGCHIPGALLLATIGFGTAVFLLSNRFPYWVMRFALVILFLLLISFYTRKRGSLKKTMERKRTLVLCN